MVVGCGALGNEVLKNLALCGVGNIVCVDFDIVETGNLTRSVLFRKKDAEEKRLKVDVVKERLLELNPAANITSITGDIAHDVGLGLIKGMDVVIGCVDSRWARFMINRHCMRTNTPWVDGAIELLDGTARVFQQEKNCYACNLGPEGLKELHRRMPCSNTIRQIERAGSVPTTSISASVIGAIEVQEALKIIAGEETICGKIFYYDGGTMDNHIAAFRAWDDDCPEHESWSETIPTDISCSITVIECLEKIKKMGFDRFDLRDDCFVDHITHRSSNQQFSVMTPGRKVEETAFLSYNIKDFDDYYQNEYRTIDDTFPYQDLSLKSLGIPTHDILPVFSQDKSSYILLQ